MNTRILSLLTASLLLPAALRAQEPKATVEVQSGDPGGAIFDGISENKPEAQQKLDALKAEQEKRMEEAKKTAPSGGASQQQSEAKESSSKSESSTSSSSSSGSSISSSTINVNGRPVTITREKGPDGKEKITVTTVRPGGKIKVRELTAEEFQKEFGDKRKSAKKDDGKADPKKPEPAAPAVPKLPSQDAATE